jgi:hypothetical protein
MEIPRMAELNWSWPEITVVLMHKLAPGGVVITRKDLGSLPQDRVLVEERLDDGSIHLWWASVENALDMREPLAESGKRAGVTELSGRWQKIAVVLLWKLAKDGLTLTQWDRDQVPHDKTLLAHGHAQDIEYRFVPRTEAARIAKWERDNEGKKILEVVKS